MRKRVIAIVGAAILAFGVVGCSSKRQIDDEKVGSWPVEGTSWRGFCMGPNAAIYVPGKSMGDPDELEAVIYDDYRCIKDINPGTPSSTSKPDTDPDGIVDDEN